MNAMPDMRERADTLDRPAREAQAPDGDRGSGEGTPLPGLRDDVLDDTGGAGDDPEAWLRADAQRRGIEWNAYCRANGILSEAYERQIRRYETPLGWRDR